MALAGRVPVLLLHLFPPTRAGAEGMLTARGAQTWLLPNPPSWLCTSVLTGADPTQGD